MSFRNVSAGRGAGWITDGLAVFTSRPGPFLGACLLVGLLSAIPVVSLAFGLLGVFFYGGLINALHVQAQGGTPAMANAFDGFSKPGAFIRLLPIAALNITVAIVAVIALFIAMGPLLMEMIQQGENAKPDPQMVLAMLPKLGLAMLVLLPVGIFVGWITLLAVPRAMLDEVPGVTAMGEAVSAIFGNLGALIVNLLCLIAMMVILTVVVMIPMMVIGLLSAASPMLGTVLQIPVMAVFGGAIFALYCSIMYQAWREVFAAPGAVATPANDTFAA